MKIISKFQDFYDCGIAYGIDPNIVYIRHKSQDEFKIPKGFWKNQYNRRTDLHNSNTPYGGIHQSYLFFCGKIYPFYIVEHNVENNELGEDNDNYIPKETWVCAWSADEADDLIKYTPKKNLNKFHHWMQENFDESSEFNVIEDVYGVNKHFNSPVVIISSYLSFYRNGCEYCSVTINPNLKDMGFSRIINPHTAFQEISMYLGGELSGHEDPDLTPAASDLDKVRSHSMDEKYGFRTRPTK